MSEVEKKEHSLFRFELSYINTYIYEFYSKVYPLQKDILREIIEYSHIAQGKRYRALLCILFGKFFGLQESDIIPFAVGIEMIHTYSLIHDDLPALDNDTMRRGKPAHHVCFGEAQAILTGDALLTDAFYAMTLTKSSSERIVQAIREVSIASGSNGMVAGQMLDIMGKKSNLSVEEIHSLKTGAIIRASCIVSAILAGVSESKKEIVSQFGSFFGILFQVVDDILDEIGESSKLGKTMGKDKASGKRTYITEYGLERAKEKAKEYYQKVCNILYDLQTIDSKKDDKQVTSLVKLEFLIDCVYNKIW